MTRRVINSSNGKEVLLPQFLYYRLGHLTESHVWRFTEDQARHEMLSRRHYGPWVDGWEELVKNLYTPPNPG